ncbi:MAG: hypothetical protein ACOVN0_08285, partial [Niveispirillum sp.]|uniref:hypothetical protein n=1 Tax=Niveispirillum sp. TaxID=1917217 RepID=UPI003BA77225
MDDLLTLYRDGKGDRGVLYQHTCAGQSGNRLSWRESHTTTGIDSQWMPKAYDQLFRKIHFIDIYA